jgi:hypothetical protein
MHSQLLALSMVHGRHWNATSINAVLVGWSQRLR